MLVEMTDSKRLPELLAEKDSIDPSFTHALELLTKEINRITEGGDPHSNGNIAKDGKKLREPDFINAFTDKRPRVECHLRVPVEEFPGVNFVGKILGAGGSTLKQVQDQTNTGIAILGKGSQRDEKKAQELLESGDTKWAHLRHPLHIQVRAIGPVDQAYMRISHACTELMKLMQVTDDMITDRMKFGGGGPMRGGRGRGGRGRGMGMGMRGGRGMRGRGGPPGRGGRGMGRGGRGGPPAKRGRGGFGGNKSYGGGDGEDYYNDYETKLESGYEGYGNQDGSYGDGSYGNDYSGGYGDGYDESYNEGGYGDNSYSGYEGYGGGYGNGSGDGSGYGAGASGAQTGKPFRGKQAGGRGGQRGGRGKRSAPY